MSALPRPDWPAWVTVALGLLAIGAAVACLWPVVLFIVNTGRRRVARAAMFVTFFPPIFLSVWVITAFASFWAVGYVTVAFRSMFYR